MNIQQQIEQFEKRLASLKQKIAHLEGEIEQAGGKLREDLRLQLKELKEHRTRGEECLAKLRLENAEQWMEDDVKSGLLRCFDEIGKRIGGAKK